MTIKELSISISKFEGKKKQINIAQIKEIIKVLDGIFASLGIYEFAKLCWAIRKSRQK